MSTPPKSGVIIYAKNIKALSQFYIEMFSMALLRETDDFVSIGSKDLNIVVHTQPIEMPEKYFNRVKIFLTVDSLAKAREKVVQLGGKALDGEWSNPIFKVCNIADSEGNHIQLREFTL